MRQSTSKDILIKVETPIIAMLKKDELKTKELTLVVNKLMQDGSKYMGQVEKHKKGQWYRSKNSLKSDVQHGYGTSRWPNGAKFTGKWKDGKANGEGVYKFKSGASVKTKFYNNKATGIGYFTDMLGPPRKINFDVIQSKGWGMTIKQNGEAYVGEFDSGKQSGYGYCYREYDNYEV